MSPGAGLGRFGQRETEGAHALQCWVIRCHALQYYGQEPLACPAYTARILERSR
jgi:hypothetical protein